MWNSIWSDMMIEPTATNIQWKSTCLAKSLISRIMKKTLIDLKKLLQEMWGTTKKKDVQELPNTRKMKKKYGTFCQSVYTLLILKIT